MHLSRRAPPVNRGAVLKSTIAAGGILLDRLLRPPCILCGDAGVGRLALCAPCRAELPGNTPACRLCALPLPAPGVCGHCLRQPPPQAASLSPYRYAAPFDALVPRLKFSRDLSVARLASQLLADHLQALPVDAAPSMPELLVPVPLHRARLRQRGFNQALEIARGLGRALDLPVGARTARRLRDTVPQSRLGARERRRNLRGAFTAELPADVRRVAVVDDVMTSGHTAAEMARCLLAAGAAEVQVWTLARAVPGAPPRSQSAGRSDPTSPAKSAWSWSRR